MTPGSSMAPRAALHPAFHSEWIVPDWPVPPNVRAFVTTRAGGVSAAPYDGFNLGTRCGDEAAAVRANRAQLRAGLPSEPAWLRQVHGARALDAGRVRGSDVVDGVAPGVGRELVPAVEHDADPEADASYTCADGVVCTVLVADCMPVLLANQTGTAVAAAHAGWRGMSSGVIEAAIEGMGVAPRDVVAWLGPAIGPAQFEVGDDVLHAFSQHDPGAAAAFKPYPGRSGKWLCDLYALARRRLAALGVSAVYGGGYCTVNESRFYSFRRDRQTGRMGAFIWLES